jgi:type IV secretion system protein VirB10
MRPIHPTSGPTSAAPRFAIAIGVIAVTLASSAFTFTLTAPSAFAQEPAGPQVSPPPAVAPPPPPAPAGPGERVTVPSGTRFSVVLENGISTRSAKAGDSLYFRTSFPVTENNRIIVPVGSYLRGELVEAKRPGRIKGKGEFRMRLNTLIFPNGYTVDLTAAPRSADSGGKETMDSEGRTIGPGGKGADVGTVATTTATGAGIGAIAGGAKGAGIGAGIGGLAGLAAILLTRGPEAELPRGSTLDIVIEHSLALDGNQIQYNHVGQSSPITPPPVRVER